MKLKKSRPEKTWRTYLESADHKVSQKVLEPVR